MYFSGCQGLLPTVGRANGCRHFERRNTLATRQQLRPSLAGHAVPLPGPDHWHRTPPQTTTVPPFQPAHYTATLESVTITNTRSRDEDSDKLSASVAVGSGKPVTLTKDLGDVDNGTHAVHLRLPTVLVSDPHTGFAFNYLVLNSGHKSWEETNAVLKKVGDGLASAGAKAATSAVGAAIGATAGGVVLPVIGSLLGAAAGWLVGEVTGLLTADCDGPVAAEQVGVTGQQLWANTQSGVWRHTTYHPGTDSACGCGSNSIYLTTWSIARS